MQVMTLVYQTPNIFIEELPVKEDGISTYARYFNKLVNGHLHPHMPDWQEGSLRADENDLVIVDSPLPTLRERILSALTPWANQIQPTPESQETSVLYVRQPRRPIKSILLIVRGRLEDEIAIGWMLRVARASQANVYNLAIIPDIPALYNRYGYIPTRMEDLVAVDSISGYQLRGMMKLMAKYGIEGHFNLVQSSPNQKMLEITKAMNCDLAIIAAESRGKLVRMWLGELVKPLLQRIECPLLVACNPSQKTAKGRGW
jgi:nucleotide-binding universal stress UspA family protein